MVTDRVLDGIKSAGLAGLLAAEEIENVRFQRKPKLEKHLPKYYHIEVARSRITIDHEHSVIKYGNRKNGPGCPLCRQIPATYDFFRNLSLNMEKYEGYDIFQTYELCNQLLVSQRFVEMAERLGLTGLHYKKVEQYRSDCWEYMFPEAESV